ncbi:MAG: RecQ family ATP-dependent DNA helicase [Bacteroidetes bacterium]|nr:RecQ family ATP-dependent DNA helicase [Bacteroidota bacterium]
MQKTPHQILKQYWDYDNFRPLQEEIVDSVLQGNDTLALLPTGGGKSICFQVPALCNAGICLVVSPLIALMKDQVHNLKKRNINAVAVFSGMSYRELDLVLDNCVYGNTKFLYLSPERLQVDWVQERIAKMKVNLIAVDEAHCVSQWGYDFRPPYLKIAEIRKFHPKVPVLALTASATTEVQVDIMQKLAFKKENIFRKSFARANLNYMVFKEENKEKRAQNILQKVQGTSIIYVRNRRRTEQIASHFKSLGITSDFYHAGLKSIDRNKKQEAWISGKTRLIVATNAFGMGIDKPDVRTVIHFDIPDNLEAYYQEAGRAGRDEQKAYAVLLYNNRDINELANRPELNFPPIEKVQQVYNALFNFLSLPIGSGKDQTFSFDLLQFCKNYNFVPIHVSVVLNLLQLEGYISLSDQFYMASRIMIKIDGTALYNFQMLNKAMDEFIKTLLRSYEGLFDSYAPINENEIAQRCKISIDQVATKLNYLHKNGAIDYLPNTDDPQLTLLEERLPLDNISFSNEVYKFRKERYIKRIQAMANYTSSTSHCRNMLLLHYFEEKNLSRCGTCDFCLLQKQIGLNEAEFDKAGKKILAILQDEPKPLEHIHIQLSIMNIQKLVKLLNWLEESGIIKLQQGLYKAIH